MQVNLVPSSKSIIADWRRRSTIAVGSPTTRVVEIEVPRMFTKTLHGRFVDDVEDAYPTIDIMVITDVQRLSGRWPHLHEALAPVPNLAASLPLAGDDTFLPIR